MVTKHKFSPLIIIDYSETSIKIEGRLIIMNDGDFFEKLERILNLMNDFELQIDVEYFNTYSFKMLFPLLFNDRIRCIKWFFDIDDEDTVTKGDIVRSQLSKSAPSIGFSYIKKKGN